MTKRALCLSAFLAALLCGCGGGGPKKNENSTPRLPAAAEPNNGAKNGGLVEFISGKTFSPENKDIERLVIETFAQNGRWTGSFAGIDISTESGRWVVQNASPGAGDICVTLSDSKMKHREFCRKARIMDSRSMVIARAGKPSFEYRAVITKIDK